MVHGYSVSIGQLYSTEYIHSLDELPSYYEEMPADIAANSLIQEKREYLKDSSKSFDTYFPVIDRKDSLAQNFIIERRETIEGRVENISITSKLLEDTLVRNMQYAEVSTENIAIHPASADALSLAKRKIAESNKTETITFEFGIPGTHLIFSKPVLLSIATPDISDGTIVDLIVHHAGDIDFGTSGLSTDPGSACNPDGTATIPGNVTTVEGGRVEFYTCGASTFALGYIPTVDVPNSTVWTLATAPDGKVIV